MRAVLTAVLLATVALTGCASSKCEVVCEQANVCKPSERLTDLECTPYCADIEAIGARAGAAGQSNCSEQWNAHLTCREQNSGEVCNSKFEGCDETAKAWTDCMSAYCATEAAANDQNCADGAPTLYPL